MSVGVCRCIELKNLLPLRGRHSRAGRKLKSVVPVSPMRRQPSGRLGISPQKCKQLESARTGANASPTNGVVVYGQLSAAPCCKSRSQRASTRARGILCRDLCRNPPMPARIGRCRVLPLRST